MLECTMDIDTVLYICVIPEGNKDKAVLVVTRVHG
jgi:hypothetical protein